MREDVRAPPEQRFCTRALLIRNEQKLAMLTVPRAQQIVVVQEDVRCIGIVRSPKQRRASSILQRNLTLQIKNQRGPVCLVAVDHYLVARTDFLLHLASERS